MTKKSRPEPPFSPMQPKFGELRIEVRALFRYNQSVIL